MASNMSGITRQSKNIIYNVYNFFKSLENCQEKVSVFFRSPQKITAEACQVSARTVQRICDEAQKSIIDISGSPQPYFSSPRENILRGKPVTDLDDFKKDVIRRSVQEFYDRGEDFTLKKLKEVLKEKIDYSGGITSLYKILRKLGYGYRKGNDGRRYFMERKDIPAARVSFVRKMHESRKDHPRPTVYIDDTWINQNHSKEKGKEAFSETILPELQAVETHFTEVKEEPTEIEVGDSEFLEVKQEQMEFIPEDTLSEIKEESTDSEVTRNE